MGSVTFRTTRDICVFRVTKIEDFIKTIIPHFIKYPLLTLKYSDFHLWCKVIDLMSKKEHLNPSGLRVILSYYASINRGMSAVVSKYFPDIIGAEKLKPQLPLSLDPFFLRFYFRRWGFFDRSS